MKKRIRVCGSRIILMLKLNCRANPANWHFQCQRFWASVHYPENRIYLYKFGNRSVLLPVCCFINEKRYISIEAKFELYHFSSPWVLVTLLTRCDATPKHTV